MPVGVITMGESYDNVIELGLQTLELLFPVCCPPHPMSGRREIVNAIQLPNLTNWAVQLKLYR